MDVPLLVDNTYYPAKELDVLPQPLSPIVPLYPAQAAQASLQGWVVLRMKLDDMGRVRLIEVGAANPPGVFDQSAIDAFSHAKFAPAQKGGRAVNSLVEIKVRFEMK
ncbi:MAG: energy transducer TonB [Sulfuriferula sp.]